MIGHTLQTTATVPSHAVKTFSGGNSTCDDLFPSPVDHSQGFLMLVYGLGLVIGSLIYVARHRWVQRHSKDPRTWPVLGCQLEASRHYGDLLDWLTGFFSSSHRTVRVSFLLRNTLLTVDPANVQYILKTNFSNFPKGGEIQERNYDLLGKGILNVDGDHWRVQRKLASFEFSVRKLRAFSVETYREGALKLAETLQRAIDAADSNHERAGVVDVQEVLLSMTFNSIWGIVVGANDDDDAHANEDAAAALDNAQEMIMRRYQFPWWKLERFFDVGQERYLREELRKLQSRFSRIIRQRKAAMAENPTEQPGRQDVLSRLLLHQTQHYATGVKRMAAEEEGATMSEEEVRDTLVNLVMAGRDTSASALSWFVYCMCQHAEQQEKLHAEVMEVERRHRGTQTNTPCSFAEYASLLGFDTLHEMQHVHAALAETLRLYPSVPRDGKVALRDDVLPDGTRVKAGQQVVYMPYAMGRMAFLWGDDARQFKPERWINGDGAFCPESPFKFSAFQAGPRMCLGREAAFLQMKSTAAMLLRFFRFSLVPNHPVQYRMMMVMTMKQGLRVHVTARND